VQDQGAAKPAADSKPKEGEGDINDLKRQVSEMQARLDKMTKGGG
jgi:polyhydroxyalkanoate synthesis regulator protein